MPEGSDTVVEKSGPVELVQRDIPREEADQESWPEEREWPPSDKRWSGMPQEPAPDREATTSYDRSRCPLLPLRDYVVLRGDDLEFTSLHGIFVPSGADESGTNTATPILTVVRCGPECKLYKPGDYVITNPRNQELAWAWADPRPPHTTYTYLLMREPVVICRIDYAVVEQLRKRGKYLKTKREAEAKKAADEKAFQKSDLNPHKEQEIVDGMGNPISKSGMHEEVLPEGLTADTPE